MPSKPTWDALVVLQSGKDDGGKVLPMPDDELDTCRAHLESVEDDLEFINRANLRHSWQAFKILADGRRRVFQPNVCLKQVHSKHLLDYARLYTWDSMSAQNLTQHERSLMRIDGKPVAELDYAGLHIRMLYQLNDHDPPHDRDVYRPEQVLPDACGAGVEEHAAARSLVKRATNVLLNTTSRPQAVGAVQNLLRGDQEGRAWAALLRREDVAPGDVVDRIVAAHPRLAGLFFTQVGRALQTLDGMIMLSILKGLAIKNRPALGIHDSVVCRARDAAYVQIGMRVQYRAIIGYRPVIRRVY